MSKNLVATNIKISYQILILSDLQPINCINILIQASKLP